MSILDWYPPPWTVDGAGRISDATDAPVVYVDGVSTNDMFIRYDGPAVKRLAIAAPLLLRALSNIVVMVDGPAEQRQAAIDDAQALIDEIEGA